MIYNIQGTALRFTTQGRPQVITRSVNWPLDRPTMVLDLDPVQFPFALDERIRSTIGPLEQTFNVSPLGVTAGVALGNKAWTLASSLTGFIASDENQDGLANAIGDGVPVNGLPLTIYLAVATSGQNAAGFECPFMLHGQSANNYAGVMINGGTIQGFVNDGATLRNPSAGASAPGVIQVVTIECAENGVVTPYLNGVAGTPSASGGAPTFVSSTGITAVGYQPFFGRYFDGSIFKVLVDYATRDADIDAFLVEKYVA